MRAALSAAAVLLLLAAVAAGVYAVRDYRSMVARVADLEARAEAGERLSREFVKRAEFDRALRERRSATTLRIEELSHEDSDDGAYLRQRIPDGVREAALGR